MKSRVRYVLTSLIIIMQSSSCSTAHANNLINRVPRVQFSISFNIYVYNQCLCVIPNFWSVPLFFIIIIIIQRLNPPLLAYCTSTWMREGDTLCKCRCRPGQLESMMLRPHRGTASFCVDFGVKKGVKVPPSGRYDLFVPWTPGFPCVFRYQHFEEFYAWLTRVHTHKKKKNKRHSEPCAAAAGSGKGAQFFYINEQYNIRRCA